MSQEKGRALRVEERLRELGSPFLDRSGFPRT